MGGRPTKHQALGRNLAIAAGAASVVLWGLLATGWNLNALEDWANGGPPHGASPTPLAAGARKATVAAKPTGGKHTPAGKPTTAGKPAAALRPATAGIPATAGQPTTAGTAKVPGHPAPTAGSAGPIASQKPATNAKAAPRPARPTPAPRIVHAGPQVGKPGFLPKRLVLPVAGSLRPTPLMVRTQADGRSYLDLPDIPPTLKEPQGFHSPDGQFMDGVLAPHGKGTRVTFRLKPGAIPRAFVTSGGVTVAIVDLPRH